MAAHKYQDSVLHAAGMLFDGDRCCCSVAQAVLDNHQPARSSDWSKTSTSNFFKLLADLILPSGNCLPPSVHATAKELAALKWGTR